ncbi:MAG TPA: glycosyltransferase family 4 protein [Opitutaceae bacterium]|nr:glycosyltransferase family 4 protein [Opitutaceae bacterium]
MRVAHILRKYVPAEWGGTETALLGLAKGLAAHDTRSVVFHPHAPTASPIDPLAAAGCEMRQYHACVPVWGLAPAARRQLLAVGGNVLSFDLPWRLAREPGISAIHTHSLGRIGGIAGTIARRRRLPFVVTIHGGALDLPADARRILSEPATGGIEWGRVFGWWWRARHVLAEADAILTSNKREAALLRQQYPDHEIMIQGHGVDTRLFRTDHRAAARTAYPAIAGRDVLLTVARIYPVKNQLWLLQQLPDLLARHPKLMLVFAGGCTHAEYGAQVEREIARRGLGGHVLLTGGLPPGDPRLVGLMQEARAAVLPSLAETYGLIIIESWAAGLPVVTTPTSGAVELITDGRDGLLFQLAEPAVFHTAIDRLLREPLFAARLATAGLRLAETRHDITVLAGQVKDLYERLSGGKHALRHSA